MKWRTGGHAVGVARRLVGRWAGCWAAFVIGPPGVWRIIR